MDQTNIIRDLLRWLDENLDKPLSLDNVAAKAGYSKWHLQRMFKEITNQAIGSYIRARRLSRAAVALRLTSRPILDIALQYRFDSQQTFTRAFKKQFDITPALYRRNEEWCATGICPPIILDERPHAEPEFVNLPEKQLLGFEQSCSYALEEWSTACSKMRHDFWHYYLSHTTVVPTEVFGLHHVVHNSEHDDDQTVFYTTAVEPKNADLNNDKYRGINLPGGDYVKFGFRGEATRQNLQEFLHMIYGVYLPQLKLTRRSGYDIEHYILKPLSPEDMENTDPKHHIAAFDYYVPIKVPIKQYQ
ncbi:MDR efflux pump AcrAB transcriptional activator RobA [Moellerella wisconsensis]|uniref:MDR efflux pump AcrAB transcriptional activator RobA n=2 Tax=Moellerella wisconsensis TaxID=158849 RepID=A0A9Q8Q1I3_9GAMM|nr:MDR efflux pump AcrAB transcriptional activator RobA [Moellerella wisconsensis]KLN97823.1 transcriptional regulator [Moellerella wisconsensis]UNH23757.1 MDR efflux pump AcrAB transcriptional activator RobA [Moellerella wisconsensis]UNH30329.1 MDR efflux pump AcrAB transcriptional activator RobA [Moellerella wisconsensis]UNH38488.1 MDR efflux pump AcrAB transcriptional activator RobA [Moellerella wisconsensis]UNH42004.1 MDR efflux pump AcrAB transcriptional activator RobA [Moellerella wiscon